mmetsp:Transcript_29909/g.71943  ORF Transcript_29909/g.71943 Transcript_29909/m.71943 type:complete len:201 (+) Transcript_29909:555-1157(+)
MQRDQVVELHGVVAGIAPGPCCEVAVVALEHQRHQRRLDAVGVDDARRLRRQVRARNVLEDAEPRKLVAARRGPDDDVDVGHIREVRLGREAVAEDVDTPGNDRDRSGQGCFHLEWIAASVGCGRVAHVGGRSDGVDRVDDERDKDVGAQTARRLAVKDLEAKRDVVRDKLVRERRRVLAHDRRRPAVLSDQPVELLYFA